jgi:hypothetical protein
MQENVSTREEKSDFQFVVYLPTEKSQAALRAVFDVMPFSMPFVSLAFCPGPIFFRHLLLFRFVSVVPGIPM